MTTVGYGDITPKDWKERIWTIFAMCMGAGFYGYVIAELASIVATGDQNASAYFEKMETIHTYMTVSPRDVLVPSHRRGHNSLSRRGGARAVSYSFLLHPPLTHPRRSSPTRSESFQPSCGTKYTNTFVTSTTSAPHSTKERSSTTWTSHCGARWVSSW